MEIWNFESIISIMIYSVCLGTYTIVSLMVWWLVGLQKQRMKYKYKIPIYIYRIIIIIFSIINLWIYYVLFWVPFIPLFLLQILCSIFIYFGLKMNMIGVTGGIGCGKSTLTELLRLHLQGEVIDADLIGREVLEERSLTHKLVRRLGKDILDTEGVICREKLSAAVFGNKSNLRYLNRQTHPRIFLHILLGAFTLKVWRRCRFVILDAPLLFESGVLQWLCYPILVVYVTQTDTQRSRLLLRSNMSLHQVNTRIVSQINIAIKIRKATFTLCNDDGVEQLETALIKHVLHKIILMEAYLFLSAMSSSIRSSISLGNLSIVFWNSDRFMQELTMALFLMNYIEEYNIYIYTCRTSFLFIEFPNRFIFIEKHIDHLFNSHITI